MPGLRRTVLARVSPSSTAAQQVRPAVLLVRRRVVVVVAEKRRRRPGPAATAPIRQQRERRSPRPSSPVLPPSLDRRRHRRRRRRGEDVRYDRFRVERRPLGRQRPLADIYLVEERLHGWRSTRGLDGPDMASPVDAQVPAATTTTVDGRRRRVTRAV